MAYLEQSRDSITFWCFLFGIFVLYFLYKVYSHPLAKIPGPFLAKISPARFLYHAWKGDLHLDYIRCHKQYGSVYRCAPSKVVFNTLTAALAIYSNDRAITKSNGYATHPFTRDCIPSLFNCVDPTRAASKKKLIRPTTTAPAMVLQHTSIEENVETLTRIVKSGAPADISNIGRVSPNGRLSYQSIEVVSLTRKGFHYALDVISQSMFGKNFDTMRSPTHRWMTLSLERGNKHMYLQLAWPDLFKWLALFVDIDRLTYPQYYDESKKFLDLCHSTLEQGRKEGERESIYDLMEADLPENISQDELYVDAFSFMRGGGDMVAVTISAALFYVTQDREVLDRLTQEVRRIFGNHAPQVGPKLDACKYLRACVDEALRMAPPGPGVFWRTSTTDLVVDGVVLPAGTDFGVSVFALHYNEAIFPQPTLFRPDRFLEENARENFIPFLRGFRSCPAQKLAYPTILLPLARLVWEFDLSAVKTQPSRHESPPIQELYQQIFGSNIMPQYDRNESCPAKELYLQVDVFGSRIEGPVIQCLPRS